MKILILVRILWPGGVQRAAFREAYELIKRGHKVDLIFIRDTGREVKYDLPVEYKVLYPPSVKKRVAGRILWKLTSIYAKNRGDDATVDLDLILKFELNRRRYDVVIYYDQWTALFSWLRRKEKKVVFVHETPFSLERPSIIGRLLDRIGLWRSDAIITNAESNKRALEKAGYRNVYTLYLGTDPVKNPPKFNEREDIAISVTMWDSGRHPERLLEISKRLKRGKILIVGDWADRNLMREYMKFNNDRVQVTGPVTEEKLRELYMRAKVFIRFGYNERGPGMGSLEALSYGIPLVVNNGIGIVEVIKDKENGFIVNEEDYNRVAEIIEMLFSNEKEWNRIFENNMKLANSLSWEKHGERLENILKGLVSS